jgi:protein TonB
VKGADRTHEQQVVRAADMQTLLRAYVTQLGKEMQRNLVYPRQARRDGLTGLSVIRLTVTETGEILEGSLVIHKSSGHAVLDEQALRTARDSAPFPPPPRRISFTIGIAFEEDKQG